MQPDPTVEKAKTAASPPLEPHPIQLEFVAVRELTIRTKKPPSKSYELPESQIDLGGSVSSIDQAGRKFQASITVTIGDPEFTNPDLPLYLHVDLVGGFVIKRDDVTAEQAQAWAAYATRFTLLPYAREYVAALSGRAGFTPIIIPLLQLPVPLVPKAS